AAARRGRGARGRGRAPHGRHLGRDGQGRRARQRTRTHGGDGGGGAQRPACQRGLPGGRGETAGSPLLEVADLNASYGRIQVLDGVSLSLEEGGAVGILGANGAGKTTTLRAISGMVRTGGSLTCGGRSLRGLRPDQVARLGIAHVPEGRGTLGHLSVRENLLVGAYQRKDRSGVAEDIDRCLDLFPNLADRVSAPA